jgi:hypothetical protein
VLREQPIGAGAVGIVFGGAGTDFDAGDEQAASRVAPNLERADSVAETRGRRRASPLSWPRGARTTSSSSISGIQPCDCTRIAPIVTGTPSAAAARCSI